MTNTMVFLCIGVQKSTPKQKNIENINRNLNLKFLNSLPQIKEISNKMKNFSSNS